jgi:hypothetical protein
MADGLVPSWYLFGQQGGGAVPALNVQFTDAELERVRAAAARAGQALKPFAHDAILSAANDRADRVAEAFEYVTARSSELNRRLA